MDRIDDAAETGWGGYAVGCIVLAVVAWALWFKFLSGDPGDRKHGSVTVVQGGGASYPAYPPVRTAPILPPGPVGQPPTPSAVQAAIARSFPELQDVSLSCQAGRCELVGRPRAPTTDAERDRQEAMLLGGLERLLMEQGYPILGPIQFDEIDDGVFSLRVSTRNPERVP